MGTSDFYSTFYNRAALGIIPTHDTRYAAERETGPSASTDGPSIFPSGASKGFIIDESRRFFGIDFPLVHPELTEEQMEDRMRKAMIEARRLRDALRRKPSLLGLHFFRLALAEACASPEDFGVTGNEMLRMKLQGTVTCAVAALEAVRRQPSVWSYQCARDHITRGRELAEIIGNTTFSLTTLGTSERELRQLRRASVMADRARRRRRQQWQGLLDRARFTTVDPQPTLTPRASSMCVPLTDSRREELIKSFLFIRHAGSLKNVMVGGMAQTPHSGESERDSDAPEPHLSGWDLLKKK